MNCKICGSPTRKFYDQQFDDDFYYCEVCEFIAKDESKILDVKVEKSKYDAHQNTFENEGYVNMFRGFLDKTVMPYITEGRDGLDFGSGPGPVLSELLSKEYGYDMTIYDLFYAPDTAYKNKQYDLLTCTEVVEHLKEPLDYFKHFESLVKSGGTIGIMTLWHPTDDEKFCDWHYRRDKTHISFFTPKTMAKIAELVGMELLYADEKRCCCFRVK